jgi:uncharacterized protein YndB with AHSA1/START domain
MANETILISEVIPATPQRIFSAWLDSGQHSSFTGSQAAVSPFVGGAYSAWDGYVQRNFPATVPIRVWKSRWNRRWAERC